MSNTNQNTDTVSVTKGILDSISWTLKAIEHATDRPYGRRKEVQKILRAASSQVQQAVEWLSWGGYEDDAQQAINRAGDLRRKAESVRKTLAR